MKKIVSANYRVDYEFVEFSELNKFQAKVNQWITKGELIKVNSKPHNNGVFFEVIRQKGA